MVRYGVRAGLCTVDGELIDVPAPTRIFQRYDARTRTNLMASHRTGHRQRHRVGEYFWVHPYTPGIAHPTRSGAIRAALSTVAAPTRGESDE